MLDWITNRFRTKRCSACSYWFCWVSQWGICNLAKKSDSPLKAEENKQVLTRGDFSCIKFTRTILK